MHACLPFSLLVLLGVAAIEPVHFHNQCRIYASEGILYHCRFEKVLDDNEKFDETGDNSGSTTIGRFARKLLLEQEFHDTMLPRLPVPIAREIQKNLDERPKVNCQANVRSGKKSTSH